MEENNYLLYVLDTPVCPELRYRTPLLMIQVHILVRNLHRGHLASPEVINSFFFNSRLKRAKDTGVLSLCLSRHDTSSDTQQNQVILGSSLELELC